MEELSKEIIRKCREKALRLLEYSDRTEKQLRDKLKEGEFPPSAIDDAVEYVRSFRYLDDERYARSFVRVYGNGKSVREIQQKLKERGVDRETIDTVLSETEISEADTVEKLFRKRYLSKMSKDPKTIEKAVRYFGSHGYRYSDIREGIARVVEDLPEEDEC